MAGEDIQLEGGNWAKIHNTILSALGKMPLSGSEFRCLMVLFRQTYGWHKKQDDISYSQWEASTDLKRRSVIRTLQGLVDKNIIYRIDNGNNRPATWGFNKYVETWGQTSDQMDTSGSDETDTSLAPTGDETVTTSSDQMDTKTSDQMDTHKRKERSSKEATYAAFGKSYSDIWGIRPESAFIVDSIAEWADEIPIGAWEYALKECVRMGRRQNWKYLESILRRVKREGYEEPQPQPTETAILDFALEDLS